MKLNALAIEAEKAVADATTPGSTFGGFVRKTELIKSFASKVRNKSIIRGMETNVKDQNQIFMDNLRDARKRLISQIPSRQQLFYIFHLILNQRPFSYNTY